MKPFFNSTGARFLFPLVILGLNVFLRCTDLNKRDISLDEPFTIYHAQFGPAQIIDFLSQYNNPPLYELILHFWIKLFGIEQLAVRMLPMLFSVSASLALYFLGKKHFSLLTGVTASLLLSFSSLSQSYAHDCRVYSLFLLLSILSMHLFLNILKAPSFRNMALFILLTTLNIYAHYFAIILFAIQVLCVLIFARRVFIKFLACCLVVIACYIPHIMVLLQRFTHSAANGTWVKAPEGLESIYNMFWSFSNQPVTTVISILLFIYGLFYLKRNNTEQHILLLWLLIPVFGIFALSYKIPMYLDRYLIFALPAWYLLLANVSEQLFMNGRFRFAFSAVLVAGYILSFSFYSWTPREVSKAVNYVRQNHSKYSAVIVHPAELIENFSYHYDRNYFQSVRSGSEYGRLDSLLKSERIFLQNSVRELNPAQLSFDTIIYFDYVNNQETKAINTKLGESHRTVSDTVFENGYRIKIFRKDSIL